MELGWEDLSKFPLALGSRCVDTQISLRTFCRAPSLLFQHYRPTAINVWLPQIVGNVE